MYKNKITKGIGHTLYSRAKNIIPGGTQLLSKRPEMFLPNLWPAYYSKAKGYNVWDMDGKKYLDFATMGIGACSLGYADSFVNSKVIKMYFNIEFKQLCQLFKKLTNNSYFIQSNKFNYFLTMHYGTVKGSNYPTLNDLWRINYV